MGQVSDLFDDVADDDAKQRRADVASDTANMAAAASSEGTGNAEFQVAMWPFSKKNNNDIPDDASATSKNNEDLNEEIKKFRPLFPDGPYDKRIPGRNYKS